MLDYFRFRDINDLFANGQPQKARRLLMELQSRCIALRDEVSLLKLRLRTAEDALYLSQNLFRDGELYWLKANDNRLGPFCPRCYDAEGALLLLEKIKRDLSCPYCHAIFAIRNPEPVEQPATGSHARIFRFAR